MFQNVQYGHQFLVLLLLLCKFPLLISVLKPWIRVIDITNRLTPYATGLQWQQQLMDHHISLQDHQEKRTNNSPCAGTVLCLQHSHVYTLGSGTDPLTSGPFSHVDTVSGQFLEYETVKVDRGGQATYHGPGQLVLYPILDLNYFGKDIHEYLRLLETIVSDLLQIYHLPSHVIPGLTGVWVDGSDGITQYKVAAIGLKLRRWVTMHGVSVNINPDMRYFRNIVPCGIAETHKEVGSLQQWKKERMDVGEVVKELIPILQSRLRVDCDVYSLNSHCRDNDPSIIREILAAT